MNRTMQKIKTGTPKKAVSPVEQERRKQKTDAVRADIRREWKSLENYYRYGQYSRKPIFPKCPMHQLLLKKAKMDWERRANNDPTRLKVVYRPRGGDPITVKYHVSIFGGLMLTPPKAYYRTRIEAGL